MQHHRLLQQHGAKINPTLFSSRNSVYSVINLLKSDASKASENLSANRKFASTQNVFVAAKINARFPITSVSRIFDTVIKTP